MSNDTNGRPGVDTTARILEALKDAGFESPDFILCVWHGSDDLAILAAGVPPDYLGKGLAAALESVMTQKPQSSEFVMVPSGAPAS